MLRIFQEHHVRPAVSLDGIWDFVTASERTDRGKLPKEYARTICVPSAWEQTPGLENYRGKAFFRTVVSTDGGREGLLLRFGGVSHTAAVYVDGKVRGGHYDAFTPWEVVVPGLKEGEHTVVVEVDNSFGEHSALHRYNDYYSYGGITRPVEMHLVGELYIDKIFAAPIRRGSRWDLNVRVRLANWSNKTVRRRLVVEVEGKRLDLGRVGVEGGKRRELSGTIRDLRVTPWSASQPTLYGLSALLLDGEKIVDDLIDRVGFRDVKVAGRKILLNGKPIRLRGYCRHEDHPLFGCALPMQAMRYDLDIMRDLGCNFIRTSHYPNDMRFLDLCDEMGFYVWEESHSRCSKFKHPCFREQITGSTVEMVEWHYNRPSVVMWACLNECDSVSRSGRAVFKHVIGLIRKLDSSRPVTYATHHHKEDICYDLADIVSWNRYDAWYQGSPEKIAPNLREMLKWLHGKGGSGGAGKPVIMSECGGAAIYGWRHPHQQKWTEEYQSILLDETLRVYLNHPDVAGVSLWQFCDVRIADDMESKGRWTTRPRTMNNKGTVDEYRRRKLSYEAVKRRMTEAAKRWDKAK
jgi:beta-glucuronidase